MNHNIRPPDLLKETVNKNADQWAKYPPISGTPEILSAIKDWLVLRYGLDATTINPAKNIIPVSGTREALYMAGAIAIPTKKHKRQPDCIGSQSLFIRSILVQL